MQRHRTSSSMTDGLLSYSGRRRKARRSTPRSFRRNFLYSLQMVVSLFFVSWLVKGPFDIDLTASTPKDIHRSLRYENAASSSRREMIKSTDIEDQNPIGFETTIFGAPECSEHDTWDSIAFTLVTQASEDRLWMLKEFCSVWSGDISIAIFTNRTHYSMMRYVSMMGCVIERVKVITVSPEVGLGKKEAMQLYPVNKLRNLALRQVQTSHFLYLDIDFWPSQHLQAILEADQMRSKIASLGKKAVFVVPVFQLMRQCGVMEFCRKENIDAMPRNRFNLARKIQNHSVFQFDPSNFGGHGSTRYMEWIYQKPTETLEIPCFKSDRYEPYVGARYCNELPPFQEVFSGYGRNKMTWIMHLRRMGYRFFQISSFACHYPHHESETRQLWNGGHNGKQRGRPKNDAGTDFSAFSRGRIDLKYLEFKKWLLESVVDNTRVPKCEGYRDDDHGSLWISKDEADKYHRLFERLRRPLL